ncbi:MAG: Smr/MutS family protein [Spirochaetaceae bacterium]|jgi:DNA mismatch repair protein MutS2|nr:Smr/MutS family protein [Spirochaetaceae bacterium]
MIEKYLHLLEFDTILKRVIVFSKSEEAAAELLTDKPLQNEDAVTQLKKQVAAIAHHLSSKEIEPQGILPPIAAHIHRLNVTGSVLDIEEIYMIGIFVEEGLRIINWLSSADYFINKDQTLLRATPDCSAISKEIFAVLDKDGNLRDLPVFSRIKRAIAGLEGELKNIASSYLDNEATRLMLQSELPSIRDGRTVIALKAQFRGRVRGIVREVSATGQTLFVEPEEIIEKNNELTILNQQLAIEIRRVLRDLSGCIARYKDMLSEFHKQIIYIETLRTRAHYSNNSKGVFALDGRSIKLLKAKHPLLGSAAVPINIEVKDHIRMVILSGPNTGGKTVALKTVGLFVLMNQAGLAIPAEEGSVLPIFDCVHADIGDEQSIDAALSTFSAHIQNIAGIFREAGEHSLVLLDELGAGTEAGEGAAIAMALADAFIEKRCMLLVTTHHGVLKNYGWTHQCVENASMAFDSHTLLPSYRLVMGVPGESRAIDIAEHHGLNMNIIYRAREYMEEGAGDVSKLIEGLKEKYIAVEQEKEKIETEAKSLLEQIRKNDLRELRVRQKEAEIKSGAIANLRGLLSESRKKLENLVREVKEGELTREKTLAVKIFLSDFAATVQTEDEKLQEELASTQKYENEIQVGNDKRTGKSSAVQTITIKKGAQVLVGNDRRRGTVKRAGKKGHWIVEVGSVSLTFSENEIVPIIEKKTMPKSARSIVDYTTSQPAAVFELNLRGMRLEDALDALVHQLDAAVLSGLKKFAVIHGKGDGILSRGVHDFLKDCAVVADYYFSRPELGGVGRTEVVLKT